MNVSFIFARSFAYLKVISKIQNRGMGRIARPFFTRHDFKQDFLTGTFSRTEVRDQVNLCVFAPGGSTRDAAAVRLVILGARSNGLLYGCTIRKDLVVVR